MKKRIFLIAGEESGDKLGASILRSANPVQFTFRGVGGEMMAEAGLNSIFPMRDIAVMGLFEIIPKLPVILGRLDETVKAIETFDPDIILSIDCPDFSLRVQKKIAARNNISARQIHYVAPTVWAWRPGRAKAIAEYLDGILCLYPFEPPYFEKVGLAADFVGHPVVDKNPLVPDVAGIKKLYDIDPQAKLVGLYTGSRHSEIDRHIDSLSHIAQRLIGEYPAIHFFIPTFDHFQEAIDKRLGKVMEKATMITSADQKNVIMPALDAAMAVNGTIGLELAVHRVPHITCYRTGALSYRLAKMLVRTNHIHLVNILADHGQLSGAVIPEFIQDEMHPGKMTEAMVELLSDDDVRQVQLEEFDKLGNILKPPGGRSTGQSVLDILARSA